MQSKEPENNIKNSGNGSERNAVDGEHLERHSWRNWFLLVGVAVVTTVGLAVSIPPLLNQYMTNPWPWAKTEESLLMGLTLCVVTFVTYLTYQQFQVVRMRKKVQKILSLSKQRSERQMDQMYALSNVSRIMGSKTDPQSVFDCIAEMCADVFMCHESSLLLYTDKSHELVVLSTSGKNEKTKMIGERKQLGIGLSGWAAKYREPLLINKENLDSIHPDLEIKKSDIYSAMVVPIILRDELVGVINVRSYSEDIEYDNDDLQALRVFAENAGACIRHAEKTSWMRQTIRNLQQEQNKESAREGSPTE